MTAKIEGSSMYANYYAIDILCKRNYKNNGKAIQQNL